MIEWKPIETQPTNQQYRLHTDGQYIWTVSLPLTGSATHWAPINMPGEPTSCETCGKQQTCPWTNTGNGPCNGWSKCV